MGGNRQLYICAISIHALLAESDHRKNQIGQNSGISIHALLAESDIGLTYDGLIASAFLSTLSLRRATIDTSKDTVKTANFYPRSPCGERLNKRCELGRHNRISIHALLAESDHIVARIYPH